MKPENLARALDKIRTEFEKDIGDDALEGTVHSIIVAIEMQPKGSRKRVIHLHLGPTPEEAASVLKGLKTTEAWVMLEVKAAEGKRSLTLPHMDVLGFTDKDMLEMAKSIAFLKERFSDEHIQSPGIGGALKMNELFKISLGLKKLLHRIRVHMSRHSLDRKRNEYHNAQAPDHS